MAAAAISPHTSLPLASVVPLPAPTAIKTDEVAKGKMQLYNVGFYEGTYLEPNIPHGEGTMDYYARDRLKRYTGHFERGLHHGQGKLESANGDIYEGSFERGFLNGPGVLKTSNGEILKGSWFYGKLHGRFEHWIPNQRCCPRWRVVYYDNDKEVSPCCNCIIC